VGIGVTPLRLGVQRLEHDQVEVAGCRLEPGQVKLLDFGIAKALGDTTEATKSGTMKGKYAYMAPEQTDGVNVDHRSDIFACGIVLHEVLTGRRLFKGQNDVQTIERVRRCEVPVPSLQNPAVPPALDAAILKALARDPNDRWQSAAEMADALDDVVHEARFQPTHLAQLLYDLFPEGGGPRPASAQATHPHGVTVTGTGSGPSARSRSTVPPVSRTVSGAAPRPYIGTPVSSPSPASRSWRRCSWCWPAARSAPGGSSAAVAPTSA